MNVHLKSKYYPNGFTAKLFKFVFHVKFTGVDKI